MNMNTRQNFFEIAGVKDPTPDEFYVGLISPITKETQQIGKVQSLKAARQLIQQHAQRTKIVPQVINMSDLQQIMALHDNVWEMGSDEVSYLIKIGDWPSEEDYNDGPQSIVPDKAPFRR